MIKVRVHAGQNLSPMHPALKIKHACFLTLQAEHQRALSLVFPYQTLYHTATGSMLYFWVLWPPWTRPRRGSGHRGYPGRPGHSFPHGVMDHCGLKPASRILSGHSEERPIYRGQACWKAGCSTQGVRCAGRLRVLGVL